MASQELLLWGFQHPLLIYALSLFLFAMTLSLLGFLRFGLPGWPISFRCASSIAGLNHVGKGVLFFLNFELACRTKTNGLDLLVPVSAFGFGLAPWAFARQKMEEHKWISALLSLLAFVWSIYSFVACKAILNGNTGRQSVSDFAQKADLMQKYPVFAGRIECAGASFRACLFALCATSGQGKVLADYA